MGISRSKATRRFGAFGFALIASLAWLSATPGQTALGQLPNAKYAAGRKSLLDGDCAEAYEHFKDGYRSAVRVGDEGWIDSAVFQSMAGEAALESGDCVKALDHFNRALDFHTQYSQWMMAVEFPPAIGGVDVPVAQLGPMPWGGTDEATAVGRFPERFHVLRSFLALAPAQAGQQGVVGNLVGQQDKIGTYCADIVRCVCTAMRRRRQLLGPLSQHDPRVEKLLNQLTRRPGPPNHWSQAWIEVQLGCAYASDGQFPQAIAELTKSLKAGGEVYHPLTATALCELGQIALESKRYEDAGKYFMEATYVAPFFGRYDELQEAFRGALVAWRMTGKDEPFPALPIAAAWAAKEDLPALHVEALILAAEDLTALGRTKEAENALQLAQRGMAKTEMARSRIGARAQYQAARIATAQRDKTGAAKALSGAVAWQQNASPRLFQIGLVAQYRASKTITDRVVDQLYGELLRDPTPGDWMLDPYDTLAVHSSSYPAAYEAWLEQLFNKKEYERALEVADRLKRHRFFSALPLGGRTPAIRTILESPPATLPDRAQLHRAALLASYPEYEPLAQRAAEIQAALSEIEIAPGEKEAKDKQTKFLQELAQVSDAQENLIARMALGRDPSDFLMPPAITGAEVRKRLKQGQLSLSFAWTTNEVYGFALVKEKYVGFKVGPPNKLKGDVAAFLKSVGCYDKNHLVSPADLAKTEWKSAGGKMLKTLSNISRDDGWDKYSEVVIVPDGPLWYLPFEALTVGEGDAAVPLITKVKVRYAPTLGLSIPDALGHRTEGRTAVMAGKLHPKEGAEASVAAFDELAKDMAQVERVQGQPAAPSPVYAAACDRLIVYQDLEEPGKAGPLGWSPLPLDRARKDADLLSWLAMPAKAPHLVALPGFHSGAEAAAKKLPAGDDLFLATCALMASGSRTALVSRWRMGGRTTYDLTREFVREQPHSSAAEAWQRSVQLAMAAPLDVKQEPRLKADRGDDAPTGAHPFLWAGYCLVDRGSAPGEEATRIEPPTDDALKPAKAAADADEKDDDAPAPGKPGPKMKPEPGKPGAAGKAGGEDDAVMAPPKPKAKPDAEADDGEKTEDNPAPEKPERPKAGKAEKKKPKAGR